MGPNGVIISIIIIIHRILGGARSRGAAGAAPGGARHRALPAVGYVQTPEEDRSCDVSQAL